MVTALMEKPHFTMKVNVFLNKSLKVVKTYCETSAPSVNKIRQLTKTIKKANELNQLGLN